MKKCFKCEEVKPLSEFYAHPQMADGHLGKCKACTKCDVNLRYALNPEKIKAYEAKRNKTPERRAMRQAYQKKSRSLNSMKWAARTAVSNAVASGKLKKGLCEICLSSIVQAHHEDYSKPLEVRWLCFVHHRMAHGQLVF